MSTRHLITRLVIVGLAGSRQRGTLMAGTTRFACALGRSGIVQRKREGDGGTPCGRLKLRRVFYRGDCHPRITTSLQSRQIRQEDAWCDDSADRRYNRLIQRPPGEVEERLWRGDHLYDVIVELGWNDAPVRKGHGSAIFWHLARPGFTPTAGCIAVNMDVFRKLLPRLSRHCVMVIR
jgi:L,D-peptidoglycan transpeptidase YkuD (ErfK/YbiS/YcfS/YnhG family)